MKSLRYLGFLSAAVLFFVLSCQKDLSFEDDGSGPLGSAQWEFKEGALKFKGSVDTAYIDTIAAGLYALNVDGTSDSGTQQITLQVIAPEIKVGTYKTPQVIFAYDQGGSTLYYNDPLAANDFTINVTAINSTSVTGTFSGKVYNQVDSPKVITDGRFTATLKTVVTPPPPPTGDSGQVTIWAAAACSGGTGPITVKISDKSGSISTFTAAEPAACGAAGSASFKLPVGNYTWKAYCGGDSTSGNVDVTKNGCVKAECKFLACKIEKIWETSLVDGKAEFSYISTYTAALVSNVTVWDSAGSDFGGVFPITRPTGTKVQVDANQYFNLDATGKITEFHGFDDITSDTTAKVTIKYTFNAAGQMTKRAYQSDSMPGFDFLVTEYTYTGSNLTRALIKIDTGTGKLNLADITYTYDLTKTIKNHPTLHPFATELFFFQTAVNVGTTSVNPLTQVVSKIYDITKGTLGGTFTGTFTNYVIDANNYVTSFNVGGDGYDIGLLYTGYKYNVKHKCF